MLSQVPDRNLAKFLTGTFCVKLKMLSSVWDAHFTMWVVNKKVRVSDVTKYRTARTAYTARTALRVDLHGE